MRHRKSQHDALEAVFTRPAIRRMSLRGGIMRVGGDTYDTARRLLEVVMRTVLRDAVTYTELARRKTVKMRDLKYALKRHNLCLYGYEKAEKKEKSRKNKKDGSGTISKKK